MRGWVCASVLPRVLAGILAGVLASLSVPVAAQSAPTATPTPPEAPKDPADAEVVSAPAAARSAPTATPTPPEAPKDPADTEAVSAPMAAPPSPAPIRTGSDEPDDYSDETDTHAEGEEPDYPQLIPGGRLMTGAELVRTHPRSEQLDRDSRQPFFLQQARVKLRAVLHKRVRLTLSADLDSGRPVRSAFVQVRFKRAFQVRFGRFKRPISRTELTSIGRLPFNQRGIYNERMIERVGWGDRALGLMVRGKFKRPKLNYYAAIMNPGRNIGLGFLEQTRGVDVLGRVEFRPFKGLWLAVNGGHKIMEPFPDGPNLGLSGVGADAQLKLGRFRLTLETLAGQNPFAPEPPDSENRTPWAMNVLGYGTYMFDLGGDFALQPTLLGEWFDTDLEVSQDEALRLQAGCNLLWREETVRLMPQVTFYLPLGNVRGRSYVQSESYTLVVSVEI